MEMSPEETAKYLWNLEVESVLNHGCSHNSNTNICPKCIKHYNISDKELEKKEKNL